MRKRRGTRKDKEKYCFSMEHILTNADMRLDIGILLDLDASLSFSLNEKFTYRFFLPYGIRRDMIIEIITSNVTEVPLYIVHRCSMILTFVNT